MPLENFAPKHPVAFIFHFLFKALAIVWYLTCTLFSSSFVVNFVVCIVLLAADFWTVKNVSGRLLVGLRWWNEATNESGTAWRFETLREGDREVNTKEKWWFWVILIANVAAWGGLGFLALITFSWEYFLLDIIGVLLGLSNLYGYFKCSKDAKAEVTNMATGFMSSAMASHMQATMTRA